MKPLVLALGNDMLGDDGVAFRAAEALAEAFGERADILPTGEAGLPLLDHMAAYRKVLILDAAYTGLCPPGTILRWDRDDFRRCVAPSQHAAGLPQLLDLAERLGLEFPSELKVVCMEVHDPTVFRQTLTPEAAGALPAMVSAAADIVSSWTNPA